MSTNEHEKGPSDLVDTPVPFLTWRSFVMGILVSMGGFLFGYDTGQISGFLEMKDFLHRYGEPDSDGTNHFSNVRSGLIVALVSGVPLSFSTHMLTHQLTAVDWYSDGSFSRSTDR
jgi:SP family sugar:H+ symporter-like MFS transporter